MDQLDVGRFGQAAKHVVSEHSCKWSAILIDDGKCRREVRDLNRVENKAEDHREPQRRGQGKDVQRTVPNAQADVLDRDNQRRGHG